MDRRGAPFTQAAWGNAPATRLTGVVARRTFPPRGGAAMRNALLFAVAGALSLAGSPIASGGTAARAQDAPASAATAAPAGLQVETQYYTMPNGLKVVMSRDPSVPTATVGVYYGIGFRIEPRERTGFAHLFE